MNPVIVRNMKIGEGIPKICVPIVETTQERIIEEAAFIKSLPADFVEWRADWFADVFDAEKVKAVLAGLRETLQDMPLLFTFRTAAEGGRKSAAGGQYAALNQAVIQTGYADLLDVEAFIGDDTVRQIIDAAHERGVKAVASNHDFEKTPPKEEMVRRLCWMQQLGADIAKIAVMPKDRADVLKLLCATEEMYSRHADRPVITMSMAGTGVISRLCGEAFGSAVTFGAARKASAPGQLGVKELAQALALLHKSM